MPPGAYELWATQKGFAAARWPETIVMEDDLETRLEEALVLPRPSVLVVNLTPPEDPFGKAWQVELIAEESHLGDKAQPFSGAASPEGRWVQAGLDPGRYYLAVKDHHEGRWVAAWIEIAGNETELFYDLPLVRIVGEVLMGGTPIPGRLCLRAAEGSEQFLFEVDEEGLFTGYLRAGRSWWAEMAPTEEVEVILRLDRIETDPDAGGEELELTMEIPNTRIEGDVVDAWGRPVEGAEVNILHGKDTFKRPRCWSPASNCLSRADGSFEVRGLRPGMLTLTATKGELSSANTPLDLREDQMAPRMRLELRKNNEILIEVLSPSGPIDGAFVAATEDMLTLPPGGFRRTGHIPWGVTDSAGNVFLSLPEGLSPVLLAIRAAGLGSRILREYPQPDRPLIVNMDGVAGKLVLDFANSADDETTPGSHGVLIHHDIALPVSILSQLLGARWVSGGRRAEFNHMETGPYAVCVTRAGRSAALNGKEPPEEACTSGSLAPGGELVLSVPARP